MCAAEKDDNLDYRERLAQSSCSQTSWSNARKLGLAPGKTDPGDPLAAACWRIHAVRFTTTTPAMRTRCECVRLKKSAYVRTSTACTSRGPGSSAAAAAAAVASSYYAASLGLDYVSTSCILLYSSSPHISKPAR